LPTSTTRCPRQRLGDELAEGERSVTALQGYARLALLQYNGGYTSYLTVLDAEQQLFPAELGTGARPRGAA